VEKACLADNVIWSYVAGHEARISGPGGRGRSPGRPKWLLRNLPCCCGEFSLPSGP